MDNRDTASGGTALRLVALASLTVIVVTGVGSALTLFVVETPTRQTLLAGAVVLGSVCALGLYAVRRAGRTETPYWRS